jgi:hypothetical protein
MKTVESLHELKRLPAQPGHVFVKSVNKIFRHHGEWIERSYFGSKDTIQILNLKSNLQLYKLMDRAGVEKQKNRSHTRLKISLEQLRVLQRHQNITRETHE